jgi:hypothetical protein
MHSTTDPSIRTANRGTNLWICHKCRDAESDAHLSDEILRCATEAQLLKQTPSVSRAVHYVSYGTPGGEYSPEHRAAIITGVGINEQVSLCVLNPAGIFFPAGVPHSEDIQAGGTWHWPERV